MAIGPGILLHAASTLVSSVTGPFARSADYWSNANLHVFMASPPPAEIISSYYCGRFGLPGSQEAMGKLWELLSEYGIFRDDVGLETIKRAEAWRATVDLQRPFLDFSQWLSAYRNQFADVRLPHLAQILARHGILDPQQQSIAIELGDPPGREEVLRWYFMDLITDDLCRKWLQWGGMTDAAAIESAMSARPVYDLGAAITLANRGTISSDQWDYNLKQMGYGLEDQRKALTELLKALPTPSDLVRFAVRHVFEPSLAEQFGFNDEISEDFIKWHSKLGFGYDVNITDPVTGEEKALNWAQAQWWSHWVWPAPTQGYQFIQRLRATGGPGGGPRDPSGIVFTQEQLRLLLRGNDYPPIFRPMLQAISYRVIGIRQIRGLVANKIWGEPELKEGFQDMGYNVRDANVLAKLFLDEDNNKRMKDILKGNRERVLKGYEMGLLSRDRACRELYLLTLTTSTDVDEFSALDQQEQLGICGADPYVKATLDAIDTDLSVRLAGQAVAAIRKAYLRFELTRDETQTALEHLGLQMNRILQYLDWWQWELFGRGKSLAVSQVGKAVQRGVISPQDALQRLLKLEYQPVDALALLQMMTQDRELYLQRAQEKLARNQQQQQRALIAQQRLLKQQLRETRSALAYNAPVSKLKAWLKKGFITAAEARVRMAALGHDAQFIAREIADATSKLKFDAKTKAEVITETPIPPARIPAGSQ